uniref:PARP catalytic domain-containing protein n=1 Tax=Arcella intermedia TaxID=1963864 RepID=A0A6B2KX99_9EUKA
MYLSVAVSYEERLALLDLFNATNGNQWYNSTEWGSSDACGWFGVTCAYSNVISLNLTNNNLLGALPSSISALSNLQTLDLSRNSISGFLPSAISQLTSLLKLNLYQNQLEGTLPAISLSYCDLRQNLFCYQTYGCPSPCLCSSKFCGRVPESEIAILQEFKNATNGQAWGNSWNGSRVCYDTWKGISCQCDPLCETASVSSISLSSSGLVGTIPSSLGSLNHLTTLNLANNNLSGTIPTQLVQLRFGVLDLSSNQLSGTIPSNINTCKAQYISLSRNKITGTLPAFSSFLRQLYLDYNYLTGSIPLSFSQISVQTIILKNNSLSGSIPPLTSGSLCSLDLSEQSPQFYGGCPQIDSFFCMPPTGFCDLGTYSFECSPSVCGSDVLVSICKGSVNHCTCYQKGWTKNPITNLCESTCGDGIIVDNEECDDNNTLSGDGCSEYCIIESGWKCHRKLVNSSILGGSCATDCGDGILIPPYEECDDGNPYSNDGCTRDCKIQPGWTCTEPGYPCYGDCGDGVLVFSEECDDGNNVTDDGCTDDCKVMTGWICSVPGRPCLEFCGDGKITGSEVCDDYNVIPNDGCDTSCRLINPGWQCPSINATGKLYKFGGTCKEICGDGAVVGRESCDDANLINYDGCSSNCSIEVQYWCPPSGGACSLLSSLGDSNENKLLSIVLPIFIISILIIILVVFIGFRWYKSKIAREMEKIPAELKWFFDKNRILSEANWQKHEMYWFKELVETDIDYQKMKFLLQNHCDGELIMPYIKIVQSIYNPTLMENFLGQRNVLINRIKNDPLLFQDQGIEEDQSKRWIKQLFLKKVERCSWNAGAQVAILPVVHGTSLEIAQKILSTGFANLSSLDNGWYGKGIYFSSSSLYCLPYLLNKKHGALIISFILPGNPYPVTEDPEGPDSLLGKALISKYQSHYIIVNLNGKLAPPDSPPYFDEIVISQESQIMPLYLLQLSKNISPLIQKFQRETLQNDTQTPHNKENQLIITQ